MNPVLYGTEHIIYVILSIITGLAVCICAKIFAKTEKSKKIIIKGAGVLLFIIILTNRIALVFEGATPNWLKLITDSVCSTSSYVLSLAIIFGKKNNNVLQFVWFISLAGGIITTFAPNFIGQNPSFLYPPTILGLMHHTWSAIVVILLFEFNYITLSYKKWYCTLFGFTSYLAFGGFLITVLNYGNPFYMVAPAVSGTPFTIWVIAPIYIVVYSLIVLTAELVRKHKSKKVQQVLDQSQTL